MQNTVGVVEVKICRYYTTYLLLSAVYSSPTYRYQIQLRSSNLCD